MEHGPGSSWRNLRRLTAAAETLGRGLTERLAARVPWPGEELDVGVLRAVAERRRRTGFERDPGAAHPRPPVLAKPQVESVAWPRGGGAERLSAESEFEPFDPEVAERWHAQPADRRAGGQPAGRRFDAWLLRRPGAPRPVLICVAPLHRIGPRGLGPLFATRRLDFLGLDLALVPLPFEAEGAGTSASLAGPLGGDPLWTCAGLAKTVWDLRRLAGWLRSEGAPAVGVAGVGVGATAAALLAGIDPRLVAAVLDRPVVSPAAHRWRAVPEAERNAAGIDAADLETILAPVSPLRIRPLVPHEGRLLLAARADRVVPSGEIIDLQGHWQQPTLHWRPGGHALPGGRAAALARIEDHLRATLVAAGQGEALLLTRFRGLGPGKNGTGRS